jgi:hypothetical protein
MHSRVAFSLFKTPVSHKKTGVWRRVKLLVESDFGFQARRTPHQAVHFTILLEYFDESGELMLYETVAALAISAILLRGRPGHSIEFAHSCSLVKGRCRNVLT